MIDHEQALLWGVVVVAAIAGYAVVSWVMKRLKRDETIKGMNDGRTIIPGSQDDKKNNNLP